MRGAWRVIAASSRRSRRFSMPKCANSLPVTRVSSAHTVSAAANASSARGVISPRLPIGVGHTTSFPAMGRLLLAPDGACTARRDSANGRARRRRRSADRPSSTIHPGHYIRSRRKCRRSRPNAGRIPQRNRPARGRLCRTDGDRPQRSARGEENNDENARLPCLSGETSRHSLQYERLPARRHPRPDAPHLRHLLRKKRNQPSANRYSRAGSQSTNCKAKSSAAASSKSASDENKDRYTGNATTISRVRPGS